MNRLVTDGGYLSKFAKNVSGTVASFGTKSTETITIPASRTNAAAAATITANTSSTVRTPSRRPTPGYTLYVEYISALEVNITLKTMSQCLENFGKLYVNASNGTVYLRNSHGEDLPNQRNMYCRLNINVPVGRSLHMHLLGGRTDCPFGVFITDPKNKYQNILNYCAKKKRERWEGSRKFLVPSGVVDIFVTISENGTLPFVFDLRFESAVDPTRLQLHYDSPVQGGQS